LELKGDLLVMMIFHNSDKRKSKNLFFLYIICLQICLSQCRNKKNRRSQKCKNADNNFDSYASTNTPIEDDDFTEIEGNDNFTDIVEENSINQPEKTAKKTKKVNAMKPGKVPHPPPPPPFPVQNRKLREVSSLLLLTFAKVDERT